MRRSFVALYLTSTLLLASATPRAWYNEDSIMRPNEVAGIRVPHRPGGYKFNVLEHLAGIAPYFDSPGVQLDPSPPDGCSVTKATYIVRHSNIYANDFDYETYLSPFLEKLANYTNKPAFKTSPDLAFLASYSSPITNETEQIEKMTPSGGDAAAAFAGVIQSTYPNLLNSTTSQAGAFRVWAASASRDVDTASSFISGLGNNATLVTVNEGENDSADSLTPHTACPAFDASMGSVQSGAWQQTYTAPLIERFNAVAPGFNFTLTDIVGMQQFCGYDTVIRNQSDFCAAFTADEWLSFEYANDLMYFYSIGWLGLPWVRSALDILSANDTQTFNQTLYMSFTHREEPPLVLTALGLFNNSAYYPALDVNSTMPTDRINHRRAWRTSEILPFLGHVGIERLQCANATLDDAASAGQGAEDVDQDGAFVRVLVNGAPIPIPECQDGPGESCALSGFAAYIAQRVAKYGDFIGACGINDTVANRTDLLSIYNAQ
ncbi:phosphoglycerate mutase-like protein [Lenzites betulinus]|nr:phosphoglycerate mutase-like protein [Lenzites betulinus]